ncbi:MAG TPA: ribosome recycling factor [Deltaproteobacteria bacterium]|nr:MAG: ribosome recycling factor [Deltaproteobacteria bacterium GWA2_55_82]OGQ63284.1 MAG: ribosome recycling factor [Deltaproteobacteria bacterium RIFCSPLOWO2_02_FULL_55_12]OIJ73119.1 MAG: ribosome recycling factor [Deltaproteobacteria bacterium GWC2_55_46]HBG47886.1 ribosome recycling factor [Deltaproteobacteria bacterium]HCY11851.1 ribosome recycling factor [Deltaproteobacteria bacterium]
MKEEIFSEMKKRTEKAIEALAHELGGLRTGRASLALLDHVKMDYYGTSTPIKQIATLSVPESRTITIQPWDVSQLHAIEKAIMTSDLGLNPSNDGKIIRISIPALTEERRKELVKLAKKYGEECKVSIRNVRRDANEGLKKLEKDKGISEDDHKKLQKEVQDIIDKQIHKVDEMVAQKETEIMEV